MLIKIDLKSEVPIYAQIKNQIVKGIASGELVEGESLPSVRQLAEDIGVNMHTVNKSYSLLKNDGYVLVHKRKGVVINELSKMHDKNFLSTIAETLQPMIAEVYCKGVTKEEFLDVCKSLFNKYKKGHNNGS